MQAEKEYYCDFCKFVAYYIDDLREHQHARNHVYFCQDQAAKGSEVCEAYFVSDSKMLKHRNKTGHGLSRQQIIAASAHAGLDV